MPWPTESGTTVLTDRTWKGDQSWNRESVHRFADQHRTTIRVTIHRDGYDFQSYGKVEVLTPGKEWSTLIKVGATMLAIKPLSYVSKEDEFATAAGTDTDALVAEAATILGLSYNEG